MGTKIVLLGAGGVAESLLYNLTKSQLTPIALYNRTRKRALQLVNSYSPTTKVIDRLDEIPRDADGYIFALSDQAIPIVAKEMPPTKGIWMHTSATVPLETLSAYHDQSAIFYPLNTFSPSLAISFERLPLFYETKIEELIPFLTKLASDLGATPIASSLLLRQRMHIAAVFSCNFVNHLLAKGSELMAQEGLSFDLLKPLIQETIRKALAEAPAKVQTGPARRKDYITIERHRRELSAIKPDLIPLYDLLTSSILEQYHRTKE